MTPKEQQEARNCLWDLQVSAWSWGNRTVGEHENYLEVNYPKDQLPRGRYSAKELPASSKALGSVVHIHTKNISFLFRWGTQFMTSTEVRPELPVARNST
jgi:hypothetical protein